MEKIPSLEDIAVLLTVMYFGQELGPSLGTLLLIVFGWFTGAVVGLFRMKNPPRQRMAWFVLLSLVVTLGASGLVSKLLADKVYGDAHDWLFLVAIAIPAIGEDWIAIGRWILRRGKHKAEQAIGSSDGRG